jgi:hypothetical protein
MHCGSDEVALGFASRGSMSVDGGGRGKSPKDCFEARDFVMHLQVERTKSDAVSSHGVYIYRADLGRWCIDFERK